MTGLIAGLVAGAIPAGAAAAIIATTLPKAVRDTDTLIGGRIADIAPRARPTGDGLTTAVEDAPALGVHVFTADGIARPIHAGEAGPLLLAGLVPRTSPALDLCATAIGVGPAAGANIRAGQGGATALVGLHGSAGLR